MASTIWKGYITFGLISIPVRLFAAARTDRISFNMLHEPCSTRIKQQLFCPTCDRVVERSEIVKGYEAEKNEYVLVTDEDLKNVAPPSSESMEILEFVQLKEIDPLFFDASYYATPEEPGRRAYQLLLETMQKTGYAAIAKVAMHNREYTVVIRPREDGLTLHTIYYANEVRAIPEYGQTKNTEVKAQEIQLAEQLVKSLAASFDPEKYEDAYQKRLSDMIEAKREGKAVKETKGKKLAPVIDLMAALQRSLNQAGTEKKPAASTHDQQAGEPRKSAGGGRKRRAAGG
jgi:DNA end-binding protein Ku